MMFGILKFHKLLQLGKEQYMREDYSEACETFRQLAVVKQKDITSTLWLGRSLVKAKRYDEADECLNICKTPQNTTVWELLVTPWRKLIISLRNQEVLVNAVFGK